MKKPLIVGAVYTEIVNYVDVLPKGNEDFTPKRTEMKISGSGYEMARVLNAFGFPYELMASAGTGEYGDAVKQACAKENIPLHEKDGINGCMYTLVDDAGNEGFMCVPGSEYDFDLEDIQYLDPDEISFVVLFGEMLTGEHAVDLIQALDDLQKPMIFVPGNRGDEIDEDIMHAVFQFEPELFLNDTEAYFIAGAKTKEMKDTAELLHQESEAPVYIYQQMSGMYYQDDQDAYLIEETRKVPFNMVLAGYLAGRIAGVNPHQGLSYAVSFAEECRNKLPSKNLMEMEKRKLADLILGKK